MTTIAIYCVNYHSYDSLNNYLDSIETAMNMVRNCVQMSVVVADNSVPAVPIDHHYNNFSLNVIPTGDNLGYFGAVEYAMGIIAPNSFDYVIISNVDVLLTENSIQELINTRIRPEVGWVAPAIYSDSRGFDWNPQAAHRYSAQHLKLLRLMFRYPILLRIKKRFVHSIHNVKNITSGSIYAGHGSFVILTKEYFRRCGNIHYPVFLYGEEIYLAEECFCHDLGVVYIPQIRINDIGSVSTSSFPSKAFCKYNYEGIDFIIKTYYNK